jgi:hypothetical protein
VAIEGLQDKRRPSQVEVNLQDGLSPDQDGSDGKVWQKSRPDQCPDAISSDEQTNLT